MSTGALLYPIGYIFLDDNGTPVNAGKVYFSRTGTSTAQDSYSDSTLDTANANPVVLNSAGRASTAIYGNPSSGYDYRIRLTTSADVQVWSYDDIVVAGADTAAYAEGSFTGSITGCTTAVTGTVTYKVFANSAGTGKLCVLSAGAEISGTSNTTAMTMTGLPAACTPTAAVQITCGLQDNTSSLLGQANISAAGTTITFAVDQPFSATGFTNSNVKGIFAGWSISFPL